MEFLQTIEACLFDLDGTLVDSENVWVEAQLSFLRRRGMDASREEISRMVHGHAWNDIFGEYDRLWFHGSVTKPEMEADTTAFFETWCATHDIVIHSSLALLKRLSLAGFRIGIVSGSTQRRVRDFVEKEGLVEILSCVIAEGDYERGKPAPDSYLAAARALSLEPARCLAFEDSQAGVDSAKSAGMRCVGFQNEGCPALTGADAVFADLGLFTLDKVL